MKPGQPLKSSPKILLVSTNRYAEPAHVYPLGLACIASASESAGFTVRVFDCAFDTDIGACISSFNPDYIGVSLRNIDDCYIENTRFLLNEALEIVSQVQQLSKVPIILGGSGFSIFPEHILAATHATCGVLGEGEETLVELIKCLSQSGEISSIPGIVYWKGEKIVQTQIRPPCQTVSVSRSFTPLLKQYIDAAGMLNVQTQRGCGYHCCYCSYPIIEGKQCRFFDPALIALEFKRIQDAGGKFVFITDSVFNTSVEHVVKVCEELIRHDNCIQFGCFLRPSRLTPDVCALLKRAGLTHIEFGSDSLCDEVLQEYQKGFTFDDIAHASECAYRAGIHYAHFLISGGPGETLQTLQTSFINAQKLKKTVFFPFIGMRIFPQTSLYKRALLEKVISVDTNLLAPQFYLSPHITLDAVKSVLSEYARSSFNWIVGEPSPAMKSLMQGLRAKGVVGPLWEFLTR